MSLPKINTEHFDEDTITNFFLSINNISYWSRTDHIQIMMLDYKNDLETFIESSEGMEYLLNSYNHFKKLVDKDLSKD